MFDIYFWSKNGLSIEELKKDPNLEFTTIADKNGDETNFIFLKGEKSGGYYRGKDNLEYLSGVYVFKLLFYLYEKYDAMYVADASDDAYLCEMSLYLDDEDFDTLVEYSCRCTMHQVLEQIGNLTDEFEALYRKSEEKYDEMTARRNDVFGRYFNDKVPEPKESENSETPLTDEDLPF